MFGRRSNTEAAKTDLYYVQDSIDGGLSGAVDVGSCYISARMLAHNTPRTRSGSRHSFVKWKVICDDGRGNDRVFERMELPEGLGDADLRNKHRIYESNQRIFGPVPFHNDIRVEIGLYSAKQSSEFGDFLGMVAELGGAASRDPWLGSLSGAAFSILPAAGIISRGFEIATSNRSPLNLEVMARFEFDGRNRQPGIYVNLFGALPQEVLSNLVYDEKSHRLLVNTSAGPKEHKLLQRTPYIVFEVRAEEARNDWYRIPELQDVWEEVRSAYIEDIPEDDLQYYFGQFERTARTCPDLIQDDVDTLVRAVASQLMLGRENESARIEEMAGGRSAEMIGMQTVVKSVVANHRKLRQLGSLRDLVKSDSLKKLRDQALQIGRSGSGADARTKANTPAPAPTPTPPSRPRASDPVPHRSTPTRPAPPTARPSTDADALFDAAMAFTKGWEGGYVNDARDRGGETNYGITHATLRRWQELKNLPRTPIAELTFDEAKAIYREMYFDAASCGDLPELICIGVFDARVNHSPKWAGRWLQSGLNVDPQRAGQPMLRVDGDIGRRTIEAAQNCDEHAVMTHFCNQREDFYQRIVDRDPTQERFINGWKNRVNSLRRRLGLRAAESFAEAPSYTPKTPDFFDDDFFREGEMSSGDDELEGLVDALAEASDEDVEAAAAATIRNLQGLPADQREEECELICEHLSANKAHTAVAAFSQLASSDLQISSLKVGKYHIQALIEQGDLEGARKLSDALQKKNADLVDTSELLEITGLKGRISKQLYMNAVMTGNDPDPEYLRSALETYQDAYKSANPGPIWHGINAVALKLRGQHDRIKGLIDFDAAAQARDILQTCKDTPTPDMWTIFTQVEALIALGDPAGALETLKSALRDASATAQPTLFQLVSLERQLREVWLLDQAAPGSAQKELLNILTYINLRLSGSSARDLNLHTIHDLMELDSDFQNEVLEPVIEKSAELIYRDGKLMNAIKYLKIFSELLCSVVKIQSASGRSPSSGSGFIVKGELLSDAWRGRNVLVTNFHVISPDAVFDGSFAPEEAEAHFSALEIHDMPAQQVPLGEILWYSPFLAHDCTIVDMPTLPEGACALKEANFAPPNPRFNEDGTAIGQLNVIGHPAGRPMEMATHGTDWYELRAETKKLVDESQLDVEYLFYNSPTEPGSSGSPVVDARTLELIGLHHASRGAKFPESRAPELSRRPGTPQRALRYRSRHRPGRAPRRPSASSVVTAKVNEGIWLQDIKNAIARFPDGVPNVS